MSALAAVELLRFSLPFRSPVRTSYGEERSREGTLVRVVRADGVIGWGECAALARPDYHHEFADGAFFALRDELGPLLLRGEALPYDQPMARSALELAVLDASLRAAGESLSHHFGGTASAVAPCATVGIGGDRPATYRRLKLKVATRDDLAGVAEVRAEVDELAVDANGAFTLDDVDALRALADVDLLFIEQPFAEPARIELGTPVCLDESITSHDAAMRAIDLGQCDIVCIKAARLGGYREAKQLHDACQASGVPAWCGGMYDAGISKAANLALASLPGFMGGDLTASSHYFERDISEPFEIVDGALPVPAGPGLGVVPDDDVLDEVVVSRASITR